MWLNSRLSNSPGRLKNSPKRSRQRGAALVIVMLIVAVVVLLSVEFSSDYMRQFRRVENQLHSQQAWAYMLGAEGLARQILLADLDSGKDIDHAKEQWLENEQVYANEQAKILAKLSDLDARFNLNSLKDSNTQQGSGGQGAQNYTEAQRRFIRLLQTLPLTAPLGVDEAEQITNAVIDWLDKKSGSSGFEQARSPGGAEDLHYGDLPLPYRAANRAMQSPSELRLVKGVNDEIYSALLPYVTVWGKATGTVNSFNVNTASANMLRTMNVAGNLEPLDESRIQDILSEQAADKKGFEKPDEAITAANLQGDKNSKYDTGGLVVTSDYFLLTAYTEIGERIFPLQAVLKRDSDKVQVIARSQADL